MKIVLSRVIADDTQTDGRRAIREEHVSDDGQVVNIDYVAEAGYDAQSALTARAAFMTGV